jgi:hypothetical protein
MVRGSNNRSTFQSSPYAHAERGRLKKNLAKCFSLVHEFSYPVNKPKEEGSVIEEGSVMEEGLVSST